MKYETINELGSKIPIPESYRDAMELVRSDYFRCKGERHSFIKMFIYTVVEPSFAFLFWFRLSSYGKGFLNILCRIMHRHYMFKYGLFISPKTKIGYGLLLGHPIGIVVNGTAIIGNNVNLSQFTTIGSNKNKAAVIGDNVYIGPSVSIIENVIIGNNATIGAGSIVTKNVDESSVVAGNPAKVINSKVEPGIFIGNRYCF